MRKTLFVLAPAALLLAFSATTQAASNAQITITGSVQASTCDVGISTNNLDLGTFTPADFVNISTPVAASSKQFTLGLSNCAAPAAAGDKAGLIISGQTLAGTSNIFSSSTSANTGIMLSKVGAAAGTYLSNGETVNLATAGETPVAGDFAGKTLVLQAGLAKNGETATIGQVSAPILFQFAYN